jgi:hypothetical protein
MKVQCNVEWELGEQLDAGGFGTVFAATNPDGAEAAVKLVPKEPGADRELLFVELAGARNVVPIIDRGETADAWALVMPIARPSLESLLEPGVPMPLDQTVKVLTDVATALDDISAIVVHRDLKPSNILYYEESWCLADFGISRYVEASTAEVTRKFSLTPAFAAPEQWRGEHATPAADVYAFGVIAYRLLTGHLPFPGATAEDLREQHLHSHPEPIQEAPPKLAALIDNCLTKAPAARPPASRVLARMTQATAAPRLQGAAALAAVNQSEVRRAAEQSRAASQAQTEAERRSELAESSVQLLGLIGGELLENIRDSAPDADIHKKTNGEWSVELGGARLVLAEPKPVRAGDWGGSSAPAFDVVVEASISVIFPADAYGYRGRSHSLYFCDAVAAGVFAWFETAFMNSVFSGVSSAVDPFALSPSKGAGVALAPGIGGSQVAWPFTELVPGDLDEFLERWLDWFARGAQHRLTRPSTMPEQPPQGTWRSS